MAGRLRPRRVSRPRPAGCDRLLGMILVLGFLGCAGAALVRAGENTEAPSVPEEGAGPVVCLLPAEIDRFGRQLTIVGARQKIETSRADCLARGGETIDQQGAAPQPKGSMR